MDRERAFLLKQTVGVLYGGWSSERAISLNSGACVMESLKKQGFKSIGIDVDKDFFRKIRDFDVAFIALHGKPGEDGTIQGILDFIDKPYTGSGVAGSSIGMDKILSKSIFVASGLPTPEFYYEKEIDIDKIIEQLGFPVVVKPRAEGSSVGMVIVKGRDKLAAAVKRISRNYPDLFFEKYIPGMIATCGILNEVPLPILEIAPRKCKYYDYKSKYTQGMTEYIIPARLPEDKYKKTQQIALTAHKATGGYGFSRVDFVFNASNDPYVLEVNTIPGLLQESNLPLEARAIGINYDALIYEILKTALVRFTNFKK
jgi:D-alanine-D-alanine ligase